MKNSLTDTTPSSAATLTSKTASTLTIGKNTLQRKPVEQAQARTIVVQTGVHEEISSGEGTATAAAVTVVVTKRRSRLLGTAEAAPVVAKAEFEAEQKNETVTHIEAQSAAPTSQTPDNVTVIAPQLEQASGQQLTSPAQADIQVQALTEEQIEAQIQALIAAQARLMSARDAKNSPKIESAAVKATASIAPSVPQALVVAPVVSAFTATATVAKAPENAAVPTPVSLAVLAPVVAESLVLPEYAQYGDDFNSASAENSVAKAAAVVVIKKSTSRLLRTVTTPESLASTTLPAEPTPLQVPEVKREPRVFTAKVAPTAKVSPRN